MNPNISTDVTPKMVTEGARTLDLWADESLREEIDVRRMAELVWKAMAPHSQLVEALHEAIRLARDFNRGAMTWLEYDRKLAALEAAHPRGQ